MNIHELTLETLVGLIRKGELSPKEVAQTFYERTYELNPKYNAFITINERLLGEEFKADLPLASVPIAIKDNIVTAGIRTTCGSRMLSDFVPPFDATAVLRLKKAGAKILGKTNMDEFAMGSSTEYSYFGPARNPHDPERVAGGSSGGSAVAVAAGMAPAALGSDTGGSVRQPAAFCGIVGFKPSYGRISRFGLVAFASSFDQIGFLTKSVRDTTLLYEITAGPDPKDASMISEQPPPVELDFWDGRKPKIAVLKQSFDKFVDEDIRKRLKEVLEKLPAEIHEVSIPELSYIVPIYCIIAPAEASANLARYDGVRYGFRAEGVRELQEMYYRTRSEGFGDEVKMRIMVGTFVLSIGYAEKYFVKAQKARRYISNKFRDIFSKFDFIITPTVPNKPFKLGEKLEDPVSMYLQDTFTVIANLIGSPAITIPIHRDGELPYGMQIIAAPGEDSSLLSVAAVFENRGDRGKLGDLGG